MQRYNMFYQVHKGLRALLYETALQVQHTDFWNVEEADRIVDQIEEVVALFEKHAHTEDNNIFPAIEKYEPSVADAFVQEHVKDHELGALLCKTIAAYRNAAILPQKALAGKSVQLSFVKFMVFNIEHMAKEEELLNEILWRYYSDAELMTITHQIIVNIPPEAMLKFSKWMIRGLNIAEITAWLKQVEQTAPEAVFQQLFITAERELEKGRFRLVLEGLTEGAMIA